MMIAYVHITSVSWYFEAHPLDQVYEDARI